MTLAPGSRLGVYEVLSPLGAGGMGEVYRDYDVSPDGQRFLMMNSGEEDGAATQISIVLNFFDELTRRVPAP